MVLSYKSNKKSLITVRDRSGDLVLNKNTLKAYEHGTEVSLFVINPSTMRGIFYNYTGAVSPMGLSELLKKQHDKEVKYKREQYKNELTECGIKVVDNLAEKVRKKFADGFQFTLLATPTDLGDLLTRYESITKVILRSSNALSESGRYMPLEDVSRQGSVVIDIDKNSLIKDVKERIIRVFKPYAKQREETALKVFGLGYSGEDLNLTVGDNNDNFGKIHYDDFVDLLPKEKWRNYSTCEALQRIILKLKENEVVFGDVPKDFFWKIPSIKECITLDEKVLPDVELLPD